MKVWSVKLRGKVLTCFGSGPAAPPAAITPPPPSLPPFLSSSLQLSLWRISASQTEADPFTTMNDTFSPQWNKTESEFNLLAPPLSCCPAPYWMSVSSESSERGLTWNPPTSLSQITPTPPTQSVCSATVWRPEATLMSTSDHLISPCFNSN